MSISFSVKPLTPEPGTVVTSPLYIESSSKHTRQEKTEPEWSRNCSGLYEGTVSYDVEDLRARPEPFTPPIVTMAWKAGARGDSVSDGSPKFIPGQDVGNGRSINSLEPTFSRDLKIPVRDGDLLELTFTLHDPDTGKTLIYKDKVKIKIGYCA
jgi:hypothetical protein